MAREVSQSLPVLCTDGLVVLVDDDQAFVETLRDLLAGEHRVAAFSDPGALHRFMAPRVDELAWERKALADLWRAQVDAHGTVALEALRFFTRPQRFEAPLVLISDYAMPLESGLSLCARYQHAGLRRILLTGVADCTVGVAAFNSGSIEQFVQKQGQRFPQSVVEAVGMQLAASALARATPLADQVAPALADALAHPAVRHAFSGLLVQWEVREYMLLGEPQGLLAVDRGGRALWIQLETEASLQELQDVLELAEVGAAARERVARHGSLVAVEWMQQLGQAPREQAALVLGTAPLLLAAVFPLDLPAELRPALPAPWR